MRRHRRRALRRRYGRSGSPLSPTLSPRVKQWVEETEAARAAVRQAFRDEASGVHPARPAPKTETRRQREKREHTSVVRKIARLGATKRRELTKEKTARTQQHRAEAREAACSARETRKIAAFAEKAATARSKAAEADREIIELVRQYPTVSKLATTLHV